LREFAAAVLFDSLGGLLLQLRDNILHVSGDREHGFQTIVSGYFAGS
jgi:hypothetical protein